MITISLCMIVKNEEDVLARCLASVQRLADEIIIVDTGSTDKTVETASLYTDKVFHYTWNDDFAAARNFSFSKASMQYCMWLDADDVIEESDLQMMLDLKKSLSDHTDFVMMRYNTSFDDDGTPTFWYYRERLMKNNGQYLFAGAVHEAVTPCGKIIYYDAAVSHRKLKPSDPDRNLNIYTNMLAEGKTLNARELHYYGRELYYHTQYEHALQIFMQFLSLRDGWIENKIEACLLASHCFTALNDDVSALSILLKTLEYGAPRAEICCELGNSFLKSAKYTPAIFWYKTALACSLDSSAEGFIKSDCYDYIPALQLCVCYDKIGDRPKAIEYNNLAGSIKPTSPAYLYNKKYFSKTGL